MNTFYIIPSDKDAMHHGVLGMKWGIRRYQPYSVVPRQSGKTGKEIGDAANYSKSDIKEALNNPKGYSDSFIKNVTKGLNNSQKKSMNNAIQNDKWDLDFLESIQNSKIFNDDNTEAMAKEYNKFLKDPEYYMTEGAYKLKRA